MDPWCPCRAEVRTLAGSSVWRPLSRCIATLLQRFSWPPNIIQNIAFYTPGATPPLNTCKPPGSRDQCLCLYSKCWACVLVASSVRTPVVWCFAQASLQRGAPQEAAASVGRPAGHTLVLCVLLSAGVGQFQPRPQPTLGCLLPSSMGPCCSWGASEWRPLLVGAATVPKCRVNCSKVALSPFPALCKGGKLHLRSSAPSF